MPVDFDEYQDQRTDHGLAIDPDTHAYRILSFLGDDPERGFKPTEIANELGIKPGSVRGTLHRLDERGLVRHAEPYWAFGDDDRLAGLAGSAATLQAVEERYGDDDFDDWEETAVDPRDERGE